MTKISWKPGTMLAPLPPVMVTCGTMEKPNVLTVAWTGIVNSEPPLTYISVRPSRYSHSIIQEAGEFVINITTLELSRACDYCGIKSGKNTDKFKDMELEIEPCTQVKAPMLVKAPISLECKVKSVSSFETHDMFLAEIVNVNVDDKYLEEDGRLALEKAGLLAFVHGRYYTLGRDLGAFGFSVDKTKENKTKPRKSKFAEMLQSDNESSEVIEKPVARAPLKKRPAAKLGRDEKPYRSERRPARDGEERPYRSERRPTRDGEERPYRSERRPARDGDERPYRSERRPARDGEERPYRSERRPVRNGEERPYRSEHRPARDGEERPYRSERRPARDGEERPYRSERRPVRDGDERRSPRDTGRKFDGKPKFGRPHDSERSSSDRRPPRATGPKKSYPRKPSADK